MKSREKAGKGCRDEKHVIFLAESLIVAMCVRVGCTFPSAFYCIVNIARR